MNLIIRLYIALKQHFSNKNVRIAYLALLIAVIITIVYNQELDRKERERQYQSQIAPYNGFDHDQACYMIERQVTAALKSPATAQFPIRTRWQQVNHSDGTITIESYVDSQNGFGALLRTRFRGYFKQSPNDKWYMYDIQEIK